MDQARPVNAVELGKGILAALLVLALSVAIGFLLGDTLTSPRWQDAVRVAVLGALFVAILGKPVHGLMLWIILAPYSQASYTTIWRILNIRLPPGVPSLTLDRLAVGLLTVVWVAQLAARKKRMRRPGAVEICMIGFCIMVLPAAAAGMSGLNSTGQLLLDKFITPFLVFVLAKNLYEEKNGLDRLMATLAVIGLYLAFMVSFELLTDQPVLYMVGRTTTYTRSLRKITSLLGNPAFLGTVLSMIAPMALYKARRERSRYGRAFWAGLTLATFLGAFFCYNRGVWVAMAAALLVLLLERQYRRIMIPVILIGLVVALVYWQAISESAVVTERLSNVSSIRFRVNMLEVSRKIIRDSWLFGVGVDNFSYYYLEYGGHWETLAYDEPTPHSTYISVLATMGVVSLIPYVLIFLSMFLKLARLKRRSRLHTKVDAALLVSSMGVIAVYAVSSAAVDLHINAFTSQVFFLIMGTVLGYVSERRSVGPNLQEAKA